MNQISLDVRSPQGSANVPVGPGPLMIGRGEGVGLELTDERASRRHCVIELRSPGPYLRDLGSRNGTFLNGQRVSESYLRDGDEIAIGNTRLRVVESAVAVRGPRTRTPAVGPDDPPTVTYQNADEEELTEADVVSSGDIPPRTASQYIDDSPLPLASDDDLPALPPMAPQSDAPLHSFSGAAAGQYETMLSKLAEGLPDKPFAENEIGILNARGTVSHAAGEPRPEGQRREAVDILRLIMVICSRAHSTDIHLEPKASDYQLRIRIDGGLVDVTHLPTDVGVKLCALVKIMCDIDVTQRTIVQEGHFSAVMPKTRGPGDCRVDYRVSFAPSVFGQKMVIRVFDAGYAPSLINELRLPEKMVRRISNALAKQSGMLLVCGPTGSGKTTTLYALVRSSDVEHNNVVTIEDPVEVQIEGVTQIQVDDANGKSFSALLRSVLRQDPDCILVGEIRDAETARTAMQAALTGHMVFSTVHTTNAVGTIFRLLDLGVEPYMVAQGLHLVLAQRLVRQLCPYCKRPQKPTPEQRRAMGKAGANIQTLFSPQGCPRCLGTGYAGRRAFFELLDVENLRDLIMKVPTLEEIRAALEKSDFEQLDQSGYDLVRQGIASFDEINSAVGR